MRLFLVILLLSACTTLGPMPSTTGVSAIPAGRPGAELQLGAVPSFHLSSAVTKPRGSASGQAAILIEPDRWINLPGLIVGGRVFGSGEDTPGEPLIGYRRALDDGFAIAGVVYGTSKRATTRLASYHGFRLGAEGGADGRIAQLTRWLALHAQASMALTRIVASGTYCIDPDKLTAKDCDEMTPANNVFEQAQVKGLYPSGTAQLSLDFARHGSGLFHSLRLAILMSVGRMPRVEAGEQTDSSTYFTLGLAATLGFGSTK